MRLLSFLTASVITAVSFALVSTANIKQSAAERVSVYGMYLDELDESLYNIGIALKKALYASSATQLNALAAELSAETAEAKKTVSELPLSAETSESLNRFLSQAGDYTLYLSKKAISGAEIQKSDRDNLNMLVESAESACKTIENVRAEYNKDGTVVGGESDIENGLSEGMFGTDFEEFEELISNQPSLIYDGPFSDHMLKSNMKMLSGEKLLTAEEAKARAEKMLGIDLSSFCSEPDTEGKVPCYNFSDGNMSFSVTKCGGYIIYMRKYRDIKAYSLDYKAAVEKATEYLKAAGETNFVPTYYFADEGVCTVNFAYKEGATVCYPDLIKVGVALDNGETVILEAGGYLANHCARTLPTPKYTSSQAQAVLSEFLTVNGVKRVIIPTDGNSEKLCYEFDCFGIGGERLLVYVNVATLEEENILLIIETEGGTLTK